MAVCKCKMCGGDLTITELDKIVTCEYCGTTQTVPSADNEKKMTLFNRANRLRMNSEFDKAAGIYENIIAEFPEEAEAYWGALLCKYGIEYVDDPATGEKKPTCHRASFEKAARDEYFELAMEYADVTAQKVYRDEAREIDRINEEILSISRNEQPYDIFICYKETDESGNRTPDSVMAQDIYDALTGKGYKVFFSRITLEDKLGLQYEPYIFAALNSAKIMLCVGTKYEYFHAVWVKNEWSRFLRLSAKDKSKVLIPCYRDMDPYDMPDEFRMLQAQDLGKLGAMQDLTRGVAKILGDAPAPVAAAPVDQISLTTSSLLRRAFMYLEDGEWSKADEYAEKTLDLDPENGDAYLVKAMAAVKVRDRAHLSSAPGLREHNDFKRALRYGSEKLHTELKEIKRQEEQEAQRKAEEVAQAEAAARVERERLREEAIQRNSDRENAVRYQNRISTGKNHTLGVSAAGKVFAVGNNDNEKCGVIYWDGIKQVSAGNDFSIALREDGTVVVSGKQENGPWPVSACKDAVGVSAGEDYAAVWFLNGTVKAFGKNLFGRCEVENWTRIVQVAAGYTYTIGLLDDGRVVTTGKSLRVEDWAGCVSVAAGENYVLALRSDGRVYCAGSNGNHQCDVGDWEGIVSIAAGRWHTVGLRTDGTPVAVGENRAHECDVGAWRDIVAVTAGRECSLGLRSDGRVLAIGENEAGRCETISWDLFSDGQTVEDALQTQNEEFRQQTAKKQEDQSRRQAIQELQRQIVFQKYRLAHLHKHENTLRKELETRIADLEGQYRALCKLAQTEWRLPVPMDAPVTDGALGPEELKPKIRKEGFFNGDL